MLEKGRRFRAEDFPKTNWNLRRWLWMPAAGLSRPLQDDLPAATSRCSPAWASAAARSSTPTPCPISEGRLLHLAVVGPPRRLEERAGAALRHGAADARRGAVPDRHLSGSGAARHRRRHRPAGSGSSHAHVAVYFGEPGKTVPDPYFGGEGPDRTGCIHCGGCMTRLPLRRQEHARQELPLPRREARPADRGGHRGRPGCAQLAERRLPGRRQPRVPAGSASAGGTLHRAQRDLRGRRAGHGAAAVAA